jgi:sulfocyanin
MRTTPVTLLALAVAAPLAAQDMPAAPDPRWITYDTATRQVTLQLDAATSPRNGGLNFEGYAGGDLSVTLPAGWSLTVRMANRDANLPHSLALIAASAPVPVQVSAPAVAGAATPDPVTGTPPHASASMTFTPPAGRYRLVCAVPGHAMAGMWIWLDVTDSVRVPILHAGD